MVILGIESSAVAASAAILKDGKIISEMYVNAGLTHSVTLLPLISEAVSKANISSDDIDVVAVANGPGSFTGVRIGVATAKGIAQPKNLKCVPVSTLESIAYPLKSFDCIAAAVMDARCNQVYCALFDCHNGNVTRLTDDDAISIEDLGNILQDYQKPICFAGDGADIVFEALADTNKNVFKAPELLKYQRASSVALIADNRIVTNDNIISADELVPFYLRLSQAERELKNKKLKG